MIRALSSTEMQLCDKYTIEEKQIPSKTLMERAGEGVFQEVKKRAALTDRVLVVCGTGNNGGDGYVIARKLLEEGYRVRVFAFDGDLSPDCAEQKKLYTGEYTNLIEANIIVDCIFGTGLKRNLTGRYLDVVEKINNSNAYVISVDIPSGLSSDCGQPLAAAVKADLTVAIGEYKLGHFLGDGIDLCGEKIKIDIGICLIEGHFGEIYEGKDVVRFFGKRNRNSNKGTFGSANIIAGSPTYTGAAILSLEGATRSGCGYVKLTSYSSVKLACVAKLPQVIYIDEPDLKSGAIAVGMGCGVDERVYSTVKNLLKSYDGTLIIDADALNSLSKFGVEILKNKNCKVIVTPHIKEFSRLNGESVEEINSDPVKKAIEFAKKYGVIVLLKSSTSIITDGERVVLNVRGNSSLAKGGSGDILSGFIAGTVARGIDAFESAVVASFALGRAAEIAAEEKTEYCATAQDILKNLHLSVKDILNS